MWYKQLEDYLQQYISTLFFLGHTIVSYWFMKTETIRIRTSGPLHCFMIHWGQHCKCVIKCTFHIWYIYRGCPGGSVPDFGRMFLKWNYTDITKNTYIRSWTVVGIMARKKCSLLSVPRTVPVSHDVLPIHCACPSFSLKLGQVCWCRDFSINNCLCYS